MKTVSSICKGFTAQLEKVAKQQNICANLQDQAAETYERDARGARMAASDHREEVLRANAAITNIKKLFGA